MSAMTDPSTTTATTGYPPNFCHIGSLLRKTLDDWEVFAHQDRLRARRSDEIMLQARRRKELHAACCRACGGPQ